VISDFKSGKLLADLVTNGEQYIIAKGGQKGLGNVRFKSASSVRPQESTHGGEGNELFVELELKSIADIGLVCLHQYFRIALHMYIHITSVSYYINQALCLIFYIFTKNLEKCHRKPL